MGPFPQSEGDEYILMVVDHMSKWVKTVPARTNDYKVIIKFITRKFLARFGCPRAIISDGGSHFTNTNFHSLLKWYDAHHRITTPYHPQADGQVLEQSRNKKHPKEDR